MAVHRRSADGKDVGRAQYTASALNVSDDAHVCVFDWNSQNILDGVNMHHDDAHPVRYMIIHLHTDEGKGGYIGILAKLYTDSGRRGQSRRRDCPSSYAVRKEVRLRLFCTSSDVREGTCTNVLLWYTVNACERIIFVDAIGSKTLHISKHP